MFIVRNNKTIIYALIDNEVLFSNYNISQDNINHLYLSLFDESYYCSNIWGTRSISSAYLDYDKVHYYLISYDYLFIYGEYKEKTITINNVDTTDKMIVSDMKKYGVFPFKNGKLKLNELLDFYENVSVLPYDYKNIVEISSATDNGRAFTDLFWNDMNEDEFINSFQSLIENPPVESYERIEM